MCEVSGWIKLHKKMLEWQWYNDNNVKLLFIHCLLKSNYKDKKWKGTVIHRGSFVTSINHLSIELNLSQQQIKTALNKLILTNEINKRTTNGYTIITILNYDSYQKKGDIEQQTNNKRITNEQQTDNFQITTTKEYKNKRIKEYKRKNTYSTELYSAFIEIYKKELGIEYIKTAEKKDISGITKIANLFEEKNPDSDEEQTKIDISNFFKNCCNVQDDYLLKNLNPMFIANNINKYKLSIQNAKAKNETTKSSYNSRLNLTADDLENSRQVFLRKYGIGETPDAN